MLEAQLATATLPARRAELTAELNFAKQIRDSVRDMRSFLGSHASAGADLAGIVARLERSVPELNRASPELPAAPPTTGVPGPTGIFDLATQTMDASKTRGQLDEVLAETEAVRKSLEQIRAPLVEELTGAVRRADEAAADSATQNAGQMEADHVQQGHGADHRLEQVGTLGHRGTHEQPAIRAAPDHHSLGRGDLRRDEPLGRGDEVVEDVLLVAQHAGLVPGLAQLAAAAQRRQGEDAAVLDEDQRAIAASVLSLLRDDAGERALYAAAFGRPEAQQASGRAWTVPFLGILMDDPYDAVRFIAELRQASQGRMEALKAEMDAYLREKNAEIEQLKQAGERAAAAFTKLQERKRREEQRLHDIVSHFIEGADNPVTAGAPPAPPGKPSPA